MQHHIGRPKKPKALDCDQLWIPRPGAYDIDAAHKRYL
jgi:hypothetical protein